MVTCRYGKPGFRVRISAPHIILTIVAALMLVVGVGAAELEPGDVDQVTYYSLASVLADGIEPLANSNIPVVDLFGMNISLSTNANNRGYFYDSTYSGDMTFEKFAPKFATVLRNIDAAIEAATVDTSALEALITKSNTWLQAIEGHTDASTDHLGNISKVLGWKNGQTGSIFETLQAISAVLGTGKDTSSTYTVFGLLQRFDVIFASMESVLNSIESEINDLILQMNSRFSDVTTRQDSFAEWLDESDITTTGVRSGDIRADKNNLKGYLSSVSGTLANGLYWSRSNGAILSKGGTIIDSYSRDIPISQLIQYGVLGLSANLAGTDKNASISLLVPDSEGGLKTQAVDASNLLDMLGLIGTNLQNPLAKLAYVWADDDDIRIADKNQPVKDEIEEEFVGAGLAAVSVGNIKDVAGLSSGFSEAFSGDGKISDIFVVLSDGESFGFFSQEVADALDTTASAAGLSDEPYDITDEFWVDENGIVHPKNNLLDVTEYLEGLK